MLNLKPPSTSSSEGTNSIDGKFALISLADAQMLDIRDGELALIIRVDVSELSRTQSRETLETSILCEVRVSAQRAGLQSPQKQKQEVVAQGNVHISPITLYQRFLTGSNSDSPKKKVEAQTPTPTTSSSSSYTSPSKSGFSFAKGGGGDKLTSPQSFSFARGGGGDKLTSPRSATKSSSTRSTPVSTKQKHRGGEVLLLPINSLTKKHHRMIFPDADVLTICHTTEKSHVNNTSNVIKMLIRSKYKGHYINASCPKTKIQSSLAALETMSVSFKGQVESFYIVGVAAKSHKVQCSKENEMFNAFNNLSISIQDGDNTTTQCTLMRKFMKQRGIENTTIAYKITSKTQINLVSSLAEAEEMVKSASGAENRNKSTTPLKLCAGLDGILSKINDTLLPPLMHPRLFPIDGPLRPPKGVLIHGTAGVGKSCLAAQVAHDFHNKSKVFVRRVNCADILSNTAIVGEAEKTLTEIFKEIENNAIPNGSLLVLDDVHLICPRRGETKGSDQIAGTLLALLDGINPSQKKTHNIESKEPGGVVVLAVTTDPSSLDPALRRPGRLDVEIEVPVPDESAKIQILSHYFSRFQPDTVVDASADDIATLARLAKGFTGADCKLAVKEAVRYALSRGPKTPITVSDLDFAIRTTKASAIASVSVEIPHVSWSDIGGVEHIRSILKESIELPLTHPHLFEIMKVPPPRGIMLYGPPGVAKTLIARAIATSGNMNFLAVKGPELLSKWLGESERALASLFRRARLASPSVIFFDELDAIAQKRGSSGGSGGDRLLSQLLTELDGVSSGQQSSRVVIVGACNRPDVLDLALTRPGRMDRKIYVGLPNTEGRESIFNIALKGKSCNNDVDVSILASDVISNGYTGAEIVAICRDAALLAIGEMDEETIIDQPKIRMSHLLEAIKNMKPRTTPEMLNFYDSYGRK